MIAYVQDQCFTYWFNQVNSWIRDLAAGPEPAWKYSDTLQSLSKDSGTGISTLKSQHCRVNGLDKCELRHLWIKMS